MKTAIFYSCKQHPPPSFLHLLAQEIHLSSTRSSIGCVINNVSFLMVVQIQWVYELIAKSFFSSFYFILFYPNTNFHLTSSIISFSSFSLKIMRVIIIVIIINIGFNYRDFFFCRDISTYVRRCWLDIITIIKWTTKYIQSLLIVI